ncbi:unnamed protein product, partial [marine sediment metagenome]
IGRGRSKREVNFTAKVYALEPLGTEVILTLEAGDKRFRMRAPAGFRAGIGDEVKVSFDERKMYIFDKKKGKKIGNILGGIARNV